MTTWLLLPDAWRIELLRRPQDRNDWLRALSDHPHVKVIDWASARPVKGDVVFVAGLDLAASEFLLKLALDVRVVATEGSWKLPFGGRSRFLDTARKRINTVVGFTRASHTLPPAPRPFLTAMVRCVEGTK